MTPEEFQAQARDIIDQALNQLNTATLLLAQLEIQIVGAGTTVQTLSQTIETFSSQNQAEEWDKL
jgi:hypothetical protein